MLSDRGSQLDCRLVPLSTLLLLGLRMAWIAYLQGGNSSECRILVSLYWVHITLIGLMSFLLRKERTWSGQVNSLHLTLFLNLCSSKVHCPAMPGPSFFSMVPGIRAGRALLFHHGLCLAFFALEEASRSLRPLASLSWWLFVQDSVCVTANL